jgi:DNA processing protein
VDPAQDCPFDWQRRAEEGVTLLFPEPHTGWQNLDEQGLSALLALNSVRFFGPVKFRQLHQRGLSAGQILAEPSLLAPTAGKRTPDFLRQLSGLTQHGRSKETARAARLLEQADKYSARIISYGDREYPPLLYSSNYPLPVLYVRGALDVLQSPRCVAAVGSRKIRAPYVDLHDRFASTAGRLGIVVVSGFALGADSIGHMASVKAGGATIGAMAGGVDRPFPPENKDLWSELLGSRRAAFVSEAPFGARASSLTLRRRNKLIVALSGGVLVSQSASDGGAMNAFRFAIDDHKPVSTFASDGSQDTSGNRTIAGDPKSRGKVFGLAATSEDFEEWLRALASSI